MSLGHGIPAWDALNPELESWFEVERVVDVAQAALEQVQKASKDPEPGTRYRVVDTRVEKPGA